MTGLRRLKPALLPVVAWLFLAVSRGVEFWKTSVAPQGVDDYTAGNPLERNVYSVLILIGLVILWRRSDRAKALLRGNLVVLALFAFMALSCLWSPYPGVSFKRLIKSAGSLVLMAVVLTEDDPFRAAQQALALFFYLALGLSLLFVLVLPSLGRSVAYTGGTTWVGIAYTKNNLGQLAGLGALFFLWRLSATAGLRRRLLSLAFLLVSLFLLLRARSMTSLSMFMSGSVLLVFLLLWERMPRLARVGALLIALAVLAALPLFGDLALRRPLLPFLVQQAGRDMTFTGRTALWGDVLRLAQKHLLFGYGYGGFWVGNLGNDLWAKYVWHPNQAHNGYLDILTQLGVAGLILVALVIISGYRTNLARLRSGGVFGVLGTVMITAILFNNLFESSLTRLNHLCWTVFLLFALAAAPPASPLGTAAPAEGRQRQRPPAEASRGRLRQRVPR